jgi:transcription elongation GreA/GreB family factor
VKGDEKRRVDSREGVRRAENADARNAREQGSRQEVRTSEPKERLNPNGPNTKVKSKFMNI